MYIKFFALYFLEIGMQSFIGKNVVILSHETDELGSHNLKLFQKYQDFLKPKICKKCFEQMNLQTFECFKEQLNFLQMLIEKTVELFSKFPSLV